MYSGRARWVARCLLSSALLGVVAITAPSSTRADAPAALTEEKVDALALSADELSVDLEDKTARATGHVVLSRGDITVKCDQVDVRYDEFPAVTWARGSGNVSLTLHGMRATAGQVEVHLKQQIVVVSGGVVIQRGKGEIRAQAASISMQTGKVTLTQVKGTLPIEPDAEFGPFGSDGSSAAAE